ncbi:MAG: hemolysin family protein [Burkholderiaceae bacterium]|jgi:putative hemolysin|nr:hemolysin family protein [Burkholderiaceae bacterium]
MDVLLIVLLTLCNGLFAMSEMALAASRKARLEAMREAGDRGAGAALALMEEPTHFLSTVQVGMTLVVLINGLVGEAAFRAPLAADLTALGLHAHAAGAAATVIVVAVITFVTIVFGELAPKRIGQLFPETVARWVAQPMTWMATLAKPFVALLALSTQGVLKLLRVDAAHERTVTAAEISASLEEGVDAGLIEAQEHQMVRNVFHLDDRPLTSLMVPRGDIEWLEAGITAREALAYVAGHGEKGAHSWYPVCRGGLDEVIGVISVARLLDLYRMSGQALEQYVTPAAFVPETLSGLELLEQLRHRSGRLVFVVDEYGVVQGLMTPHDLLEAITGELKPGALLDAWATPRSDGSWILDGLMPVSELKARLQIKELPLEDKGLYNTLAGLLLACTGHLPTAGERIVCANWIFQIVALEGRRIDRILALPAPKIPCDQN